VKVTKDRYAKHFPKVLGTVRPKAVFLYGVSATGFIGCDEFALFAPDMATLQRMWLRLMPIPLDDKRVQQIAITRQTTVTKTEGEPTKD
jgi:hypothetical protein